ncbi:MAG: hypothetical protein B7Y84_16590 [Azorhizobium sp. 32-67-21]|nr:MAG: hypothetical protein B7Y84_16590 [Azorhizobium sp. 32-67-21]
MRTQLVSIETPTTPLDGAFHLPDDGPVRGGVLLFHGNTMNFYMGAPRFLPPVLTAIGYACLAFNRRGHDILSIRNSRATEGGAYQTTAQALEDNALAADWMAARATRSSRRWHAPGISARSAARKSWRKRRRWWRRARATSSCWCPAGGM